MPNQCNEFDTDVIAENLGCPLKQFPCPYLGMPLSDKSLRKVDFQPALDKLSGKAKGWIQRHFSIDARLILVKHVLSAMMVFQMIALAPPIWLTKAVDEIRCGFLGAEDEIAPGGKCLVNWKTVCRLAIFGGSGSPICKQEGWRSIQDGCGKHGQILQSRGKGCRYRLTTAFSRSSMHLCDST